MQLTNEEIARAISEHHVEDAVPYLSADVTWDIVGGDSLAGSEAVISACRKSQEYLAGVTTTFRRFSAVVGDDRVVVDSLADYVDGAGEPTTVASCDLYEFAGGMLTSIRSYNMEVAGG